MRINVSWGEKDALKLYADLFGEYFKLERVALGDARGFKVANNAELVDTKNQPARYELEYRTAVRLAIANERQEEAIAGSRPPREIVLDGKDCRDDYPFPSGQNARAAKAATLLSERLGLALEDLSLEPLVGNEVDGWEVCASDALFRLSTYQVAQVRARALTSARHANEIVQCSGRRSAAELFASGPVPPAVALSDHEEDLIVFLADWTSQTKGFLPKGAMVRWLSRQIPAQDEELNFRAFGMVDAAFAQAYGQFPGERDSPVDMLGSFPAFGQFPRHPGGETDEHRDWLLRVKDCVPPSSRMHWTGIGKPAWEDLALYLTLLPLEAAGDSQAAPAKGGEAAHISSDWLLEVVRRSFADSGAFAASEWVVALNTEDWAGLNDAGASVAAQLLASLSQHTASGDGAAETWTVANELVQAFASLPLQDQVRIAERLDAIAAHLAASPDENESEDTLEGNEL